MKNRTLAHTYLLIVLALSGVLVGANSVRAPAAPNAPTVDAQWFSYSIARGSPSTALGVHPADILGAGGVILIPCANLGLLCEDPVTGVTDDITALAYGDDFGDEGLPAVEFSVAAGAQGAVGTAVRAEAGCSPTEPQADAFQASLDNSNAQDLDGDGVSCTGNSGFGLALSEVAASDELDALDRDPCQSIDLNCDGLPETPILVVLAPGSPTLAAIGATPSDILLTGPELQPQVWATAAELGLRSGDTIDALCIQSNGDEVYDGGDKVLLSLTAGSPSLVFAGAAPGAMLRPGRLQAPVQAVALGLAAGDDLDAALCDRDFGSIDFYFPTISRR